MEFINDEAAIGKWVSVGFVRKEFEEDFSPDQKCNLHLQGKYIFYIKKEIFITVPFSSSLSKLISAL